MVRQLWGWRKLRQRQPASRSQAAVLCFNFNFIQTTKGWLRLLGWLCLLAACSQRPATLSADHRGASLVPTSNSPLVAQAVAAWAEAERLQTQQTLTSKRAALSQYQAAYESWLAAGLHPQAVAALQRMGELQLAQSDARAALDLFQRALTLNAGLASAAPESGIYNGLSEAQRLLGHNDEARVAAETALRLSRSQPPARELARALSNLGEWAYAVGERAQAFDYYECAREEFQRMGAERDVAMMWLCQGHIFNDTGSPVKAQAYFERAQQLWENQSDLRGRALALIAFGHLQAKLGNGQQALEFYAQAQPLIAQAGDRVWEAALWLGSGYVYITMHNYDRAETSFEQQFEIERVIILRISEIGRSQILTGDLQAQMLGEFQRFFDLPYGSGKLPARPFKHGQAVARFHFVLSVLRGGFELQGFIESGDGLRPEPSLAVSLAHQVQHENQAEAFFMLVMKLISLLVIALRQRPCAMRRVIAADLPHH